MKKVTRGVMAAVLGTALITVVFAAEASADEMQRNFRAHLSGGNEVPNPTDTQAQGQAIFHLSKNGDMLYYKLIAANIENLFMAHIHWAPAGSNGPIVVWLYPDEPFALPATTPPASWIPERFDGVLAEGIITTDDMVGPLAGMSLAALIEGLMNGQAYVNVHTSDFVPPTNTGPGDFPGGEIRGQIK